MQHDLWTYPETVGRLDLSGFDVEATDGSIGKVDEATYDAGESYVVVNTGVWFLGKKVLLPGGVVDRVDRDDEKVYVSQTKDQIKDAPEFDEDAFREDHYRSAVGDYYAEQRDTDGAENEVPEGEKVADRS